MNKIEILSPTGIHKSELKAINLLEKSLPPSWYGFASFLINDGQGSMEIDLLLITDDRFILCEIKEWKGEIFSSGRNWIQQYPNGAKREHHSPVEITWKKMKRVKSLFERELEKKWGCYYFIDYAIILAGTPVVHSLPNSDKRVVFSLDDFCKLANPNEYAKHLPYKTFPQNIERPNSTKQIRIFRNWFANDSKAIKMRNKIAGNYIVPNKTDEAIFKHPKDYYLEHLGKNFDPARKKSIALLRCWNFEQAGIPVLTQETQARYVLREQRVIDFVSEEQPQTKKDYLLQPRHSTSEEDVTSDFIEIYEHPMHLKRLDEYISKKLSQEQKVDCIKNLLVAFSKLHELEIAHRDVSLERLWFDDNSKAIIISGLIVAKFPDTESVKSVSDMRKELSSSAILIPEEEMEEEIKAILIDVYMLGAIIYRIAFEETLPNGTLGLEWRIPKKDDFDGKLDNFIQKAIHTEACNRYSSASEMLKDFALIFEEKQNKDKQIREELSPFIKNEIVPYGSWIPKSTIENIEGRHSYFTSIEADEYIVKVWTTLKAEKDNYAQNRKLYNFLHRCYLAQQSQINIPQILDFGISSTGLFLVQAYYKGVNLNEFLKYLDEGEESVKKRVHISKQIVESVINLHNCDLSHGDLKPENILIQEYKSESQIFLLDLFDVDQFGNRKFNTEYSSDGEEGGAFGSDVRAVYLIVDELLSRCGELIKPVRKEIERAIGESSGDIPYSLESLLISLNSLENAPKEQAPVFILGGDIYRGEACEITAPHDVFRVRCRKGKKTGEYIFNFTGNKHEVRLIAKKEEELHVTRVDIYDITKGEALLKEQDTKSETIHCKFMFTEYSREKHDKLINLLEKTFPQISEKTSKPEKQNKLTVSAKLPSLWQAILDEERDSFPTVRVAKPPESIREKLIIELYENIDDFELSRDDKIEVLDANPEAPTFYGLLEVESSKGNILVIKEPKRKYIKENSRLQLREFRKHTSWRRRSAALKRVLENSSLISNIFDYFEKEKFSSNDKTPLIDSKLLELYEKRLDSSQLVAFKNALTKPVNVIMGPPGTGKTRLLSVLLDYLLRLPEINRILLVSQSHIPVDELAIRGKEMVNDIELELSGKNIDLSKWVRLGEIDQVRPELHEIHVETLQKQYRIDFMKNLEQKVLVLADTMKLPTDFVLSAVEAYRNIGAELYKINRKNIGTDENMSLIEERKKALMDKLYNRLLKYTDSPKDVFEQEDMFKFILNDIAKKHSYFNPSGVSKINETIKIIHDWYLRLSSDGHDFANFIAKTRKLVVGTLVGIGKSSYEIAKHKYDIVIIDEAARASASELAMAMQSAKKVILVGDHKQLPPLYEGSILENVSKLLKIPLEEAKKTDFERAYNNLQGSMLTMQYRMQPAIGDMISNIFYEGKLENGTETNNELAFLSSIWGSTVTWVDTSKSKKYESQNKHSKSLLNKLEIEIIRDELKKIAQSSQAQAVLYEWFEKDKSIPIGIITGYKDQVKGIKECLEEEWATPISELIKIDTIDSYQGGENRIIILSLVRANESKKTGFMDDPQRTNVALSRAKNNLIIIGNSLMWKGKTSPLALIYDYIEKNQTNKNQYNIIEYNK